jgi:hypothetical protein
VRLVQSTQANLFHEHEVVVGKHDQMLVPWSSLGSWSDVADAVDADRLMGSEGLVADVKQADVAVMVPRFWLKLGLRMEPLRVILVIRITKAGWRLRPDNSSQSGR